MGASHWPGVRGGRASGGVGLAGGVRTWPTTACMGDPSSVGRPLPPRGSCRFHTSGAQAYGGATGPVRLPPLVPAPSELSGGAWVVSGASESPGQTWQLGVGEGGGVGR